MAQFRVMFPFMVSFLQLGAIWIMFSFYAAGHSSGLVSDADGLWMHIESESHFAGKNA